MIVRILVLLLYYLYFLVVLVVLHMQYDYNPIHNPNYMVLKQVNN